MNEAVSIEHDCRTGKRTYDGSGVLMKMINQTVLVTCKHVLSGQSGCKHFFSYDGVEHEIDMASKRYLGSSDIQPIPIRVEGEYTGRLDDYAFYEVDFELNHDLTIAKSASVLMKDELTLVTHEPKPPGKKITLPTKRLNDNPCAVRCDSEVMEKVNTTNMISVEAKGMKRGHSGGAVLRNCDNAIVGILQGGSKSRESKTYQEAFVITIESIIQRYFELKDNPGS